MDRLKPGSVLSDSAQVCYPPKDSVYNSIEGLIHHFKIASEGYSVPEGEVYMGIEAPKGELGYYIVSDGSSKPYRMRIRPPSFVNLQAIETMAKGAMIADLVAIIGTLDIVLGEIDR
jgi:NADH-quinone oxidoreductase subunit D